MARVFLAVVLVGIGLAAGVSGCAGGQKAGGPPDAARGQKYYQAKCNACHPDGGVGAGPALFATGHALPGPLLKSSSGGRHNVPAAEWDSLSLFLTEQMKAPGTAVAAAPAAVAAPVAAATPAPAAVAAPAVAPAGAVAPPPAMKMCACTCQCPADTPPGQMTSCQCQCQCP